MAAPSYAVAGDGRLGRQMAAYLRHHGAETQVWSRRLEAARRCPPFPETVCNASTVLLALKDDAIAPFADTHAATLAGKCVVHFSGALFLRGLVGLHPLSSIPLEGLPMDLFATITFTQERGGTDFQTVFPLLPNPSVTIEPAQKPLYHALAVLSGNLASFVWNEAAAVVSRDLDVADPAALFAPYFRTLIAGFEASPYGSLTGPVARDDRATIAANLAALEMHPPLARLYRAFVDAAQATRSQGGEAP